MLIGLWFLGCGGLSDADIEAVVQANTRVLGNVEARAEQLESLVQARRHGQGDGDYVYDGSLDADGTWDAGGMRVSGSGSSRQSGTLLFYALQLDYDAIDVDGLVMTGPVDATIAITISEGNVSVLYQVLGELEIEGDTRGTADMDWEMAAASSTGGQAVYSGTINGRDIEKLDL